MMLQIYKSCFILFGLPDIACSTYHAA